MYTGTRLISKLVVEPRIVSSSPLLASLTSAWFSLLWITSWNQNVICTIYSSCNLWRKLLLSQCWVIWYYFLYCSHYALRPMQCEQKPFLSIQWLRIFYQVNCITFNMDSLSTLVANYFRSILKKMLSIRLPVTTVFFGP